MKSETPAVHDLGALENPLNLFLNESINQEFIEKKCFRDTHSLSQFWTF